MATLSITPVSQISADNDVVALEVFIAAPRERIFQALTDPKQAIRWWGRTDQYYFDRFEMDVRVGGKWSTSGVSQRMGANGSITVHGEFLELEPPKRLSYSWISSWMPASTKVVWELTPQDQGTVLKLVHSGFAGNADMTQRHSHGWTLVITWLQAFVERGETGDVTN